MFTIDGGNLCGCSNDKADKVKKSMGVVELVTKWWTRHLYKVNEVGDPGIEGGVIAYVDAMRMGLSLRLGSEEFSEESPIGLLVANGNCCSGSLKGELAVYAGAAGASIVLPKGFEPGGREMLITPHAVMIVESIWHDGTDERVEGYDTAVLEVLSSEESNPVIPVVALWLRDTVAEYVERNYPGATKSDRREKQGDLDKLYEQVATRLRNVDFKVTNAVEWGSDDLIKILRAAGSPIPAPRNITVCIEPDRVSVYTPGGVEFVVFEAEVA